MQLGFVSAIVPEFSLEAVLKCAAELKFDCVELMCWPVGKADRRYAGVTHIDVLNLTNARVDEIHQLVNESGVSISGLGYYGNPLSHRPEEATAAAEQVRHVISACARLGLQKMNTFIGRDWTKSVDENFEQFAAVWKPIIQFAEDQNVFVGIENCPMLFTRDEWPGGKNLASSPAIWRRMFEEIPSPHFGLNYDPSHMILQRMDEITPIREFASRLFHVHAKDLVIHQHILNDVGAFAYPNTYSEGKLPGRGRVRWPEFFQALRDARYDGPVCVEVEDRDYEDSLQGRKQSLVESCEFLRKFIPAS